MELKDLKEKINDKKTKINSSLIALNNYSCQKVEQISSYNDFIKVISPLSAQIKAPLFEKWLGAKLNAKKISPSLNRGDFKDKNGKYFELKQSFSNDANTLNMRQIRLWQNIDYYLVIYSDELAPENSIFLNIPKDKMILECKNASATHGTISANKSNSNIELSMSLKINSDKIKLWISQYGDKEINYENIK